MSRWKSHAGAALSFLMMTLVLLDLVPGVSGARGGQVARAEQPQERLRDVVRPEDLPPRQTPNFSSSQVQVTRSEGGAAAPSTEAQDEARLPAQIWARRRRPWIGTLAAGGVLLSASGVLGVVALAQASAFRDLRDQGGDRAELMALSSSVRQMAFATDLLMGTTALFGLITVVLRYSTGTSRAPMPPDLEPAYQVPGGEGR